MGRNIYEKVIPILLEEGVSLFYGLKNEIQLCHLTTRTYASGLVKTTYRVKYYTQRA